MKKHLTLRNLGWLITAWLAFVLAVGAAGKMNGSDQVMPMLESNNLGKWAFLIGLGEMISLILFLIPKTMKLGTLLLSAYFGGAIMFHMAHPDPAQTSFLSASIYLIVVWMTSWLRGFDILSFGQGIRD